MAKTTRSFTSTWNNYPEDWETVFNAFFLSGDSNKVKYTIQGMEIAPTTGTPHLQGHFDTHVKTTIKALQKLLQPHLIKLSLRACNNAEHSSRNRAYCKKDLHFKEWGSPPCPGKRTDLVAYMDDMKANPDMPRLALMETHSSVMARYPRFAQEYKMLITPQVTLPWDNDDCPNVWTYGPPGTGKSRMYQEMVPPPYSKSCNKWWDGYDGQDSILIDDIEPVHSVLGHHIKIWVDRYPFNAEVKGSVINIRPKRVFVTSNFHPEDIFTNPVICAAILRRFKLVEKIA